MDPISFEELEKLLEQDDEPGTVTPPVEPTVENNPVDKTEEGVEKTKAFAKRLKESTEKARTEERENIAKQLGYTSYSEMLKSRENKMLEDKGLDPEEVSPIVNELVEKRLKEDPRMKELESYRQKQIEEFGKKELAEITKLTNGEITSLSQLDKNTIEQWTKTGSLKQAFLTVEGEKYILKARSQAARGTTEHLTNPPSSPPVNNGMRTLTEEEKKVWRFFNPNITEEELNKKQVKS